ncbi:T9SS type A sorting domain-containing protein [bacterium]|nr:T9SS type A sorting domain-containing protein [bacterium]
MLRYAAGELISFFWEESVDPEGEETVEYEFELNVVPPDSQGGFGIGTGGMADTLLDISWDEELLSYIEPYALAEWAVHAWAGEQSTFCDEPFRFFIVEGEPPDSAVAISPVDTLFYVSTDTTVTLDWFDGSDPDDTDLTYAVRGMQRFSDGQERSFRVDSLDISEADVLLEQRNEQFFNPFEVDWQIATVADVYDTTWSEVYNFQVLDNWDVEREPGAQPRQFAIESVYPNPFNVETTVALTLPTAGRVRVEVYDLLGRRVTQLLDERRTAGSLNLSWHAGALPSGTYLVRASLDRQSAAMKVMLVK